VTHVGSQTSDTGQTPPPTTDNETQSSSTVNNPAPGVTTSSTPPGVTMTLTASPSSLSFGSLNVGASNTLSSTLTNSGNANVTISNVSISGAGFNAIGVSTGQILTPGQSATMNVTLTPTATGNTAGSITVVSDSANSPVIISLAGAGAQPPVQHSVSLTWNPSPSTVIGYNIYRSTVTGGPYALQTPSLDAGLTFTDTAVQAGAQYFYVVTSDGSDGVESTYSNEVSTTVP
jgi:hypothetical protein